MTERTHDVDSASTGRRDVSQEMADRAKSAVSLVDTIAKAIYDGLDKSDASAALGGDALDDRVLIDGHFNLRLVALEVMCSLANLNQ